MKRFWPFALALAIIAATMLVALRPRPKSADLPRRVAPDFAVVVEDEPNVLPSDIPISARSHIVPTAPIYERPSLEEQAAKRQIIRNADDRSRTRGRALRHH